MVDPELDLHQTTGFDFTMTFKVIVVKSFKSVFFSFKI